MKLGTEIGLGTGHNALDGDPAPHHGKGHSSPPLSAHFALAKSNNSATAELFL